MNKNFWANKKNTVYNNVYNIMKKCKLYRQMKNI